MSIRITDRRSLEQAQAENRRRIEALQGEARQAAAEYSRAINELRASAESGISGVNRTLRENHRRELEAVAERFDRQRTELLAQIGRIESDLNRRIIEDNERICTRIRSIEDRIEAQSLRDRQTADEYIARMRREWAALLAKAHLRPFTEAHIPTVEYANTAADDAYRLAQYQAVTAIMINSSLLIKNWEQEAQLMYDDWMKLRQLCEEIIEYIRTAIDASSHTEIRCDGVVNRDIDLSRYDRDGFAEIGGLLAVDDDKLAHAAGMSVEELRNFLHVLEADRKRVDAAIERASLLHCALVRRLKAADTLSSGLRRVHYSLEAQRYADEDFLKDIRLLFAGEYTGHRLIVTVATPDYRYPRTSINLTFIPGAVMDDRTKEKQLESLSAVASQLISSSDPGMPRMSRIRPYRNDAGLFQTEVGAFYRA